MQQNLFSTLAWFGACSYHSHAALRGSRLPCVVHLHARAEQPRQLPNLQINYTDRKTGHSFFFFSTRPPVLKELWKLLKSSIPVRQQQGWVMHCANPIGWWTKTCLGEDGSLPECGQRNLYAMQIGAKTFQRNKKKNLFLWFEIRADPLYYHQNTNFHRLWIPFLYLS